MPPDPRCAKVSLVCDTLRVMVVVLTMTYPLYEVVSSLTRDPELVLDQCTDQPCNYVRVFEGTGIPGTGARVIRVQNGVERPLFIEPQWQWYGYLPYVVMTNVVTVDYNNSMTVAEPTFTLPYENEAMVKWTSSASKENERKAFKAAQEEIPNVSPATTAALTVCFGFQNLLSRPIGWLVDVVIPDAIIKSRGVFPPQRIPTAYVKSFGNKTVTEVCGSKDVMKHIGNFMERGPSKIFYTVGLAGWAMCTLLHDVILIIIKPDPHKHEPELLPPEDAERLEEYTLLIGALSVCCLTVATGACFQWSTGALSIFASEVHVDPSVTTDKVACFYKLPYLQAFFALSTPMLLLSMLMSRVRSIALSVVHGDFMYTDKYRIPFKYVARAHAWHDSDELLHDIGGSRKVQTDRQLPPGESQREDAGNEKYIYKYWKIRRRGLLFLDVAVIATQVSVIALAGFNITMKGGEFAFHTIQDNKVGRILHCVLLLVVHMPSCLFCLIAFLQMVSLGLLCSGRDGKEGGSEAEQTETPKETERHKCKKTIWLMEHSFLRPLLILLCWGAGFCMWPGQLIWNPEINQIDLFQAELWGNSGVALFLLGISFVRANSYGIKDSLDELKEKEKNENEREGEKDKGRTCGGIPMPQQSFSIWYQSLFSLDVLKELWPIDEKEEKEDTPPPQTTSQSNAEDNASPPVQPESGHQARTMEASAAEQEEGLCPKCKSDRSGPSEKDPLLATT